MIKQTGRWELKSFACSKKRGNHWEISLDLTCLWLFQKNVLLLLLLLRTEHLLLSLLLPRSLVVSIFFYPLLLTIIHPLLLLLLSSLHFYLSSAKKKNEETEDWCVARLEIFSLFCAHIPHHACQLRPNYCFWFVYFILFHFFILTGRFDVMTVSGCVSVCARCSWPWYNCLGSFGCTGKRLRRSGKLRRSLPILLAAATGCMTGDARPLRLDAPLSPRCSVAAPIPE